jgi:uncharacterized YigZ family protein
MQSKRKISVFFISIWILLKLPRYRLINFAEVARNSIIFKKSTTLIKEPTYRIAVNTASAQLKEKGSKFLSFAFAVSSLNDVTLHLTTLKKSYPDATHHCYAWLIGLDKQQYKVQDDGEPSHSAGDPILGQIRSYGLTNVLVVVVRYYGGVNLGIGGLISAYKTAAAQALSLLPIQEIRKESLLIIEFDYRYTQLVTRILKEKKIKINTQHFTDKCEWHVFVTETELTNLQKEIDVLGMQGIVIKLVVPSPY